MVLEPVTVPPLCDGNEELLEDEEGKEESSDLSAEVELDTLEEIVGLEKVAEVDVWGENCELGEESEELTEDFIEFSEDVVVAESKEPLGL